MMFDTSRSAHTASRNYDSRPCPFIYGNGLLGRRGKAKTRHIKRIVAFIHNGLGLFIIVRFVFSKNLCGLDGQGAIQIDRYLPNQPLSIKLAQEIKDLLGPFHSKGRNNDLFPLGDTVANRPQEFLFAFIK